MSTKPMKYPLVGQWHFILSLSPAWWTQQSSEFNLGFFKLTHLPSEGEVVKKEYYKGFWLRRVVSLPKFGFSYNFKKKSK